MPSPSRSYLAALVAAFGVSAILLPPPPAYAQRYEAPQPLPDDGEPGYDERDGPPDGREAPEPRDYRDAPRATDDGERYDDRAAGARPRYDAADDGDGPQDISAFHEPLSRYGQWTWHPVYGDIWIPDDVHDDWRPYTRGTWHATDEYGWYWQSEEPWGWATYHYGRWAYDGERRWFWVPGLVWGPAWVAWRYSDDYVGWAPLPPHDRHWRRRDEAAPLHDSPRFLHYWIFVRPAQFLAHGIARHVQPPYLTDTIIRRTRAAGYRNDRRGGVTNPGIHIRVIERLAGRPVERSRTVVTREPGADRPPPSGSVEIYRPRFSVRGEARMPPPMHAPREQAPRWEGEAPGRPAGVERYTAPAVPPARAAIPGTDPQGAPRQPRTGAPSGAPPPGVAAPSPGGPASQPTSPPSVSPQRPPMGMPPGAVGGERKQGGGQRPGGVPPPAGPAPVPAAPAAVAPKTPAPTPPVQPPAAQPPPRPPAVPPVQAAPSSAAATPAAKPAPVAAPAPPAPATPSAGLPPAPPSAPRVINRPPVPQPAPQAGAAPTPKDAGRDHRPGDHKQGDHKQGDRKPGDPAAQQPK